MSSKVNNIVFIQVPFQKSQPIGKQYISPAEDETFEGYRMKCEQ